MRNLCLAITLAISIPLSAWAASFEQRYAEANAKLRSGDAEGAAGIYKDLQVEQPESELLYYGLGCAHYDTAMKQREGNDPKQAIAELDLAKTAFEHAQSSSDERVRRDAGYNLANTTAQKAQFAAAAGDYQAAVNAFQESVSQYEEFLKRFPDHAGARQNLEYMRYLLKSMLQNPPKEQEKNQQQQQDQEKQQEQQQQDKSEQQQEQQQQPESSQGQPESTQDQQQQQTEEQKSEGSQGQQQEQQAQAAGSEASVMPEDSGAAPEQSAGEPKNRQTVEALLQTLEDHDRREQRKMRDEGQTHEMRKEWW